MKVEEADVRDAARGRERSLEPAPDVARRDDDDRRLERRPGAEAGAELVLEGAEGAGAEVQHGDNLLAGSRQ
jgi:hypothetical protein